MALTERDKNKTVGKPNDGKRKRVEIDLTGDSDTDTFEPPPPKTQKGNNQTSNTQRNNSQPQPGRNASSAYQTPPASSASRSSQSSNYNRGGYESVYGSSYLNGSTQHSEAERDSWLADDDDINEIVGSTQAAAAQTEELHHYGDLATKVVGVRFYNGYASPGEQILLRREPGNPYDKLAIRVDNMAGTQIGHIPRRIAAKLSPLMDNSFLHVEGELAGEIGTFEVPLAVRMFGPDPASEEGVQLQAEMKQEKLPLNVLNAAQKAEKQREKERKDAEKRRLAEARRAAAAGGTGSGARVQAPSQYGFVNQSQASPSAQPVMSDIIEASERFNPREIGRAADEYGAKEEALKNMPSAEKPKSIKTNMLPYQLQGLRWLLDQENPQLPPAGNKTAVQLWKRNDRHANYFTNIATNFSTQTPHLASGGILADDMGLGKTLEMIALIVADNEKAGRKTGTTLIVAPLSVMSNWSGQIAQHVHEKHALNAYTYHGAGRVQMKVSDFAQYDVVITTYQTLASDYMPKGKGSTSKAPAKKLRPSGLYSVEWRRVILDEGHTVRNPATKAAAAVCALTSKSRWSLTGTPIVNSLKDLYSQLKFLGMSGGIEQLEIFNRVLVRPLKRGDASAIYLLQAIMAAFTLRRRKEMKFVDLKLPKLDEYVHRIDFTKKERERYDALNAEAQGLLTRYEKKSGQAGQGTSPTFQHLLEILLRMRQVCNHHQLCGEERIKRVISQLEQQKTVELTSENQKALQDILQLQIESQEDCPICLETLHNPVITTCGHFFGRDCISQAIEAQKKCPMCRAELKDETCLVAPANECADEAADDQLEVNQSSSKLDGMMEILGATKKADKTIIFSQWTRFLDIVQARLDRDGYKYARLDGTLNTAQRDAALQSLEQDPQCTILLASLGVSAVGLNLTAANQIILSDTWWAPAIEDQAVDRVHRLGQTKECRVFRLVMDKSIEDATIQIQQDKRKLMRLAFSEKAGKRDRAKSGRLDDIRRLLRGGDAAAPS